MTSVNNASIPKKEIDIALLHKLNRSESFLYKCEKDSDKGYTAQAITSKHHYYSDHTKTLSDLMYLLECARQAETYIVHRYAGQALDTHFILSNWSCTFSQEFCPLRDFTDTIISFNVFTGTANWVRNRLLSQDYRMEFTDNGVIYACVHMSVKYMTKHAYNHIRKRTENSIMWNSIADAMNDNILPEAVFRKDEANTVIKNVQCNTLQCTSSLSVDKNNTAYFDHQQDHYPAMLLMEAGKQNCQYWFYENLKEKTPVLVNMESRFFKYAEMDSEVKIHSTYFHNLRGVNYEFKVSLIQNENELAQMIFHFITI